MGSTGAAWATQSQVMVASRCQWRSHLGSGSSRPPTATAMAWPSPPMVHLPSCLPSPPWSLSNHHCGVPIGQVYSWGTGPLGHGGPDDLVEAPRLIKALAHAKAAQVACGPSHSLVLTEDNVLYSFGRFLVRPLTVLTVPL